VYIPPSNPVGPSPWPLAPSPNQPGLSGRRSDIVAAIAYRSDGPLDVRIANAEAGLKRSERWLAKVAGGGHATYLDAIDDALIVSTDGRSFDHFESDPANLDPGGRYVLHPRVVGLKRWAEVARALNAKETPVSIAWDRQDGATRKLAGRWLPRGNAALLLEIRPNVFAEADSTLGKWLLSKAAETPGDLPLGEIESASHALKADDVLWLNLQTAGDMSPVAQVVPAKQTVDLEIGPDGQDANLTRLKEAAGPLRGKFVVVTGHVEGDDFVSRFAGSERFRIPVQEAERLLRAAGADVLPIGCAIAGVVGVGSIEVVGPRHVAKGFARALGAPNAFAFAARFASSDMPLLIPDVPLPESKEKAPSTAPPAEGRLVAVPLSLVRVPSDTDAGIAPPGGAPSVAAAAAVASSTPRSSCACETACGAGGRGVASSLALLVSGAVLRRSRRNRSDGHARESEPARRHAAREDAWPRRCRGAREGLS
jgi:hypothetical protein